MPDPTLRTFDLTKARLVHQPIVFQARMLAPVEPLFSAAEGQRLGADPAVVVRSQDGNKPWCALAGWLDPVLADDAVLCRKAALEIELHRAELAADVQLLLFTAGSPTAVLVYRDAHGEQQHALEAVVDVARSVLRLLLTFTRPGATAQELAAGLELYSAVVAALSSPAGAELRLGWEHSVRVQVPPRRPHGPLGHVVLGTPAVLATPRVSARPAARFVVATPAIDAAAVRRAAVVERVAAQPARRPLRVATVDRAALDRLRWTVPPPRIRPRPEPEEAPSERRATVAGELRIAVQRPLSHPTAFPDLLRAAQRGWGHVEGNGRRLYFRDTASPDTFQYLPTHFQLGHHVEADGSASRPPMRPELYRDGDDYRVRVTLVAVPGIAEDDRETLRRHLRDVVLLGKLPFVRLEPAGGLAATFLPTFTVGGGDGAGEQQTLPASIVFRALDVDLDDRLLLEFDMQAPQYAIFAELLRRGLGGTVSVREEGAVQESIPVRLALDDVAAVPRVLTGPPVDATADGVFLWLAEGSEGSGEVATPTVKLALANRLSRPVRLGSLHAALLDAGSVAGMIFDAEEVDLVGAGGAVLAARGDGAGGDRRELPLTAARIAIWDETIPLPGATRIDGGTPQEWLDRVHQDPSLAPAELQLHLERVPVSGDERLQIVRLRVLRRGDATVRQDRELVAADTSVVWPVRLTLQELAGQGGEAPRLCLEYDSVDVDGKISLAQRLAIDPASTRLVLRPVVERPDALYTVSFDDGGGPQQREGLSRDEAAQLVDELRTGDALWRLYPTARPGSGDSDGPTGPDGPGDHEPGPDDGGTTPQPTGTAVRLVADLLAPAFAAGELDTVFVILQPPAADAAQTTLVFDADHAGDQTWTPPAGVPPFRYRITYLFTGGQPPKRVEGTETGAVLVLDPTA